MRKKEGEFILDKIRIRLFQLEMKVAIRARHQAISVNGWTINVTRIP